MRKPLISLLPVAAYVVACVLIFLAAPTSTSAAETGVFTGCTDTQGPDEFLPGLATTTLPSSGATGVARVMKGAKTIALKLPSGAAGTCYATTGSTSFDPASLVTTGARGFDIVPGDGWTVIDTRSGNNLRVACTAQLVTPKGLKIFQCR